MLNFKTFKMSNLTREKRIAAYKQVLADLEKNSVAELDREANGIFVCNRLAAICSIGGIDVDFPEFYAQKPKVLIPAYNKGGGWWNMYHKAPRIAALQKAIKLAEKGVYP